MRALAALLLVSAALAGCGGSSGSTGGGDPIVVASAYPLAWVTARVAGSDFDVVNLTPPGAEPHDAELSPRDLEKIRDAAVVVYAGSGFQPAVEDAVQERTGPSLDVAERERDPHVWLDASRFARVAEEVGAALGQGDRASAVAGELRALDRELHDGLARCARRVLVTSHSAFGHLASRYGLRQLALTGTAPEAEPGPRDFERLVRRVRESGVTAVFSEPLVSDRLAATVAREAGVDVVVLDPLEGLSQERLDAGEDYVSVMRANLATLQEVLGCR